MYTLENFVRGANVDRLLGGLSKNPSVRSRATLLKLLKIQVDQLESDWEQLALAERRLGAWKARVAEVYLMTEGPLFQGADSRESAEFLVTMHSVQGLLENVCRRLRDTLNSSPQSRTSLDLRDPRVDISMR